MPPLHDIDQNFLPSREIKPVCIGQNNTRQIVNARTSKSQEDETQGRTDWVIPLITLIECESRVLEILCIVLSGQSTAEIPRCLKGFLDDGRQIVHGTSHNTRCRERRFRLGLRICHDQSRSFGANIRSGVDISLACKFSGL